MGKEEGGGTLGVVRTSKKKKKGKEQHTKNGGSI